VSTYTPIASQTLSTSAPSVTFSSIPQGYTDLVLVVAGKNSSSTYSPYIQFNGDTSTNYSITNLYGDGSAAVSNRTSTTATAYFGSLGATQGNAIVQIQNYSNATTYKTALIRINGAGFRVYGNVMLWRSTAAITSVTVFNESPGTFASGSTFSIYGIQVGTVAQKAQGGNIVTSDGTYVYHTFTSSGAFIPNEALTVDYLVVAGGGGGGANNGGGGGAGGLRSTVTATGGGGSLESALSLTAKSYPVIIGAGGAGRLDGAGSNGFSGNNSIFSTITSSGGGGGGSWNGSAYNNGLSGGSGGGASGDLGLTGGSGTANQGYAGGAGGGSSESGGGGGAGAVGAAGAGSTPGAGGIGVATTISGSSVTYAGGGGGGKRSVSASTSVLSNGGTGGGGGGSQSNNSTIVDGGSGTVSTGSGGGGGSRNGATGGNGGSGIVIIRYAV
jgi:hypothetical protein